MPATRAIIGYLTKVYYADSTSPGLFTALEEVTEVTPPNAVADDVEATHMQSPNRSREYIQGLVETGEASVVMNRVPGSVTELAIQALQSSGEKRMWRIEWPNGTLWDFLGYIKGYETASPIDDRMTATATIKVAGATTVTLPSPVPG